MSWKFNCVRGFAAEVESIQNNSATRDKFMQGFMDASVFYSLISDRTFNVSNSETDWYGIKKACKEIITTVPTLDQCGADNNLVPDSGGMDEVNFSGFMQSVVLQACKDKCDKRTLNEYIGEQDYAAGASFAIRFDQVFLMGMPELGQAGITGLKGSIAQDFADNAKYGDLCAETVDANTVANFFKLITSGMSNDVLIVMGETAYEAIGSRAQSKTGDKCGNMWDCIYDLLNSRFTNSRTLFKINPAFDHITGIDSLAPTEEKSVIWVLDRAEFRMGLSDNEIVGCAITQGHDIVQAKRSLWMTGPQLTKQRSSRFVYNFIDQAKLIECEGDRHADCGTPGFTVPAPIPALPAPTT